jgi:hypothetical protein
MGESDKKPSPPGGGYYKKKWNNNKKKPTGAKPAVRPDKFQGGRKEELDGNHFDCTRYGQSDRFVKTVQKIADYIGQEYKCGGTSCTKVMRGHHSFANKTSGTENNIDRWRSHHYSTRRARHQ